MEAEVFNESIKNMLRSWKLGQAFGIGIYVHWTFLLLPLFGVYEGLRAGYPNLALLNALLICAVFGCVILHELGHALMARRFGIGTRDITVYPIGGVARLERMSERPWEEFLIALAGPAVNVLIALALTVFIVVTAGPFDFWTLYHTPYEVSPFSALLLYANLALIAFNLLPAFPMDGGRVLRSVLSSWLGRLRATEIAAQLGVVMAVGFFLYGIYSGAIFLTLIALFVYFAGQQELAAVRFRSAGLSREAAPADVEIIEGQPPVNAAAPGSGFSGFTWDGQARLWVYWRNGRPIRTISMN